MPEWLPLVVFLAAGVIVTLLGNIVGPLVVYRIQLIGRRRWAAAHGYSFAGAAEAARFVAERDAPGIFGVTRRNRFFDLLQADTVAVVDYSYIRELGGAWPSERTDVRRSATVALAPIGTSAPLVRVVPWGRGRLAARLVGSFPRVGREAAALLDTVTSSVETGDADFDGYFRVVGEDEQAIRSFLSPDVRAIILSAPGAHVEVTPPSLVVFQEKML